MANTAVAARAADDLYERDIVAWADQQAQLLRERRFAAVDWARVIEEIEDVAGRHRDELLSCLTTIVEHRLKLRFLRVIEPRRGWIATIKREGDEVIDLLDRFPSLASDDTFNRLLARAHEKGRQRFQRSLEEHAEWADAIDDETDTPQTFVLTRDEVLGEEWWPTS